jgi:hypothetical protein
MGLCHRWSDLGRQTQLILPLVQNRLASCPKRRGMRQLSSLRSAAEGCLFDVAGVQREEAAAVIILKSGC